MTMLRRLFHRCNFVRVAPMLHTCDCGRQRWGLFEEKN